MTPIVPPPVIGLIVGLAMWILAKSAVGYSVYFTGQALAASIIAGTGLAIDLVSVGAFFRRKTTVNPLTPSKTNTLVVEGLYRFSRNPMYLGMLMMLTGWGLWLANPLNVVFLALFVWMLNEVQIKPEERALSEKFGEDYDAYRRRVRRWI